ncbi:DNA polymerase III, gamma/tau subunits [uncultured Alphaproteobacteria bacterium]|uniref:DNA polymerase III subunit gamma/tau n=1 Tax=uncultured Alphaproteobacteria bacterium TaxID=91750 RepID=A0A212KKN5_9PROT|nr:DNA polymerase III, gamma/tau subunits [uncultured Alphaproteobacteria bacterium]
MTADSPEPTQTPDQAYRVLARKYRPTRFEDLIGQEALVRTLRNAIAAKRLASAYILTGVRGIGKTTTARIIARAFTCTGADGTLTEPTAEPCGVCPNCRAIAEDRHVDVLEMDAASRTGVNDIREILDGVRYRPTSARAKIYIIDEVHMLSNAAFNALLKTLEEPPEHVKFIFATTEIRKVPVTVLSRCQRFDLRRVAAEELAAHFANIAKKEGAAIADEALRLIARAADGSVRDGLSLLDQAIAHGHGEVTGEQVRDMLGLADRGLTFDLFEAAMKGEAATALDLLARQYAMGADPSTIVADLLELSHWLTRVRVVPASADDPTLPEAERVRGRAMAETLSMAVLTRAWQILLKGLDEVRLAPNPLAAAEMVLIRLIYAADLPTPADALKALSGNPPPPRPPQGPGGPGGGGARMAINGGEAPTQPQFVAAPAQPQSAPTASAVILPASFEALVGFISEQRDLRLAAQLYQDVRLVAYEPGKIVYHPKPGMDRDFAHKLSHTLAALTGRPWAIVPTTDEEGQDTLQEQADAAERRREAEAAQNPLVQAVLKAFPDAAITRVRLTGAPLADAAPTDADTGETEE